MNEKEIMSKERTILVIMRDIDGCLECAVGDTGWRPSKTLRKALEKELKQHSKITEDMNESEKELAQNVAEAYKTFLEAQDFTETIEVE